MPKTLHFIQSMFSWSCIRHKDKGEAKAFISCMRSKQLLTVYIHYIQKTSRTHSRSYFTNSKSFGIRYLHSKAFFIQNTNRLSKSLQLKSIGDNCQLKLLQVVPTYSKRSIKHYADIILPYVCLQLQWYRRTP